MATIGVNTTVTAVGPSGSPEIGYSSGFFVIQSPWGVANTVTACTSFGQFKQLFGGLDHAEISGSTVTWSTETTDTVRQGYYAVKGYFDEKQKGSPGIAFVVRVIDTTSGPTAASKTFADGGSNLTTITSKWAGTAGGSVTAQVVNPSPARGTGWAQIILTFSRGNITEKWDIKTAADAANASKKSQLATITLPGGGELPVTAAAALLQSGTAATAETFAASDSDLVGTTTAAGVKTGLQCFTDPKLGSGFVMVPGKFSSTIRSALASHASSYDRHALLGSPSGLVLNTVATDLSTQTGNNASYYWPQVYVADEGSDSGGLILVDNVGFIAGLGARCDKIFGGPHKAPGGLKYPFVSVLDVERASNGNELCDDSGSNTLADSFINTLRVKGSPARITPWGLRTLATDNRWRQIGSSRTIAAIKQAGTMLLEQFVIDPIDELTFGKVEAELNMLLSGFWKDGKGCLYGNAPGKDPQPTDAWFAVCNAENNPKESIDAGVLTASLSIVTKKGAERVDFNIYAAATGTAPQIR